MHDKPAMTDPQLYHHRHFTIRGRFEDLLEEASDRRGLAWALGALVVLLGIAIDIAKGEMWRSQGPG